MRKELVTLLVAVLLFAPQAEATNAIGNNAIAIGRSVTAARDNQIRIGDSQNSAWVGIYSLNALANAAGFDAEAEWEQNRKKDDSPAHIPDPRRPAIQSGVSPAFVSTAQRTESVPVAPAHVGEQATGAYNSGPGSEAGHVDSMAVGNSAVAGAVRSVAIGKGAETTGVDTIAIGAGVRTEGVGGDIAIGIDTLVYVRIGAYDLAALNAQISEAAIGFRDDIADDRGSVHARINQAREDFTEADNQLRSDLGQTNDRLNKAIAMSIAQQGVSVEPGKRAKVSLSSAGYRGEFGIAGGFGVRVNEQIQVHFSGATDTGFDEKSFKTGIDFSF